MNLKGGDSMYFPIHIKTEYSLLDSMIRIPELISYATKRNFKALAICDNNMFGVMEFVLACQKNSIKPIVGLEFKIENHSFQVYAKGKVGYHHLMKLATILSKTELRMEDIQKYASDLVLIIPFESKDYYEMMTSLFETVFEGYQTKEEKEKWGRNHLIYNPTIRCLKKEDEMYLPYLQAIQEGKELNQNFKTNPSFIPEIEESKNYEEFYHLCQFEYEKEKDLLPVYQCPNNMEPLSFLKEICKEGLRKQFKERVPKVYVDRLKYEIDVIQKMGYVNYFLIVWDYVHYAKTNGILVGPGRGSAAGSLVSYLMGITNVDPIRYNLLFERFLNPERISMPDIDMDFEFNRREEVITYCVQKYGVKNVAGIITFGTMASKQVIRDVGKCLGIDLKTIDVLTKMISSTLSLEENYRTNEKLRTHLKRNTELEKLYQIGMKLEGLKRHTSIHAAGIVMSKKDLSDVIPLNYNHENFYTTAYSMEYLEDLGLLKMDFLAIRNLTIVSNVLEELKKIGIHLGFEEIPLSDEKTFELFKTANTVGIFQFESQGMMNFLRKFKPNNFDEITAAIALFRPGPMNNIDHFIKRKRGQEEIDYIHPNLKSVLEPTYGIMIYQEQIMQVVHIMAGYSLGEADILRKAISKKKEQVLKEEEGKFIERSIQNGYTKDISKKVYDLILKFASYGFNKAHSVSYAMFAYRMAYLKAHYPEIFLKSLLSMVIGSEVKTKEYIYECKYNHISLLPPDINQSGLDYKLENHSIRFPLTGIKNVGGVSVKVILEEREKGMFSDIFDFIRRCYGKNVNKKILESLIDAGVFQTFGYNIHTLHHNLDNLLNYGDLVQGLQETLFEKPDIERVEEYSKKELMQKEKEAFGFYLSNHPVTELRGKYQTIELSSLSNYFDRIVDVLIYVDSKKEIMTKKNEKMAFLKGSDEVTSVDVVLFPNLYKENQTIEVGDLLLITAHVEKRFDKLQLVVNKVLKIEDLD